MNPCYFTESPSVVNGSGPVVIVTEGLMAHLLCSVQGQPLPSVKWLFNEKEIIQDGITMTTTVLGDTVNSVLTIGAVSYVRHRGLYVCLAENSVGEDLTAIQLIVRCKLSAITATLLNESCILYICSSTNCDGISNRSCITRKPIHTSSSVCLHGCRKQHTSGHILDVC